MEVRTCEDYVLNQLFKAEDRVDDLECDNRALHYELDKAVEKITKLERLIGTRTTYSSYVAKDGDVSLTFDAPWKKYETEDYNLMVECMEKYSKEEK